MSDINIPQNYINFNEESSKNPIIVLKILGAPDVLTNRILKTKVLYGDPDVFYGQPGLVYGGLRNFLVTNPDGSTSTFKDYLDLDASSLTLDQKLEPEQGKASVSTLTMAFIDKDEYMTNLVSPGFVLDEILLAECEVYLGYAQTSYPQDYFKVFRGYISNVTDAAGNVSLQISDANLRLRTTLFFTALTYLDGSIGATDNLITVTANTNFYQQIQQPDGSPYNLSIKNYIFIDSEWIEAEPLLQANEGFTAYFQGLTFTATQGHGNDVSIQYVAGGTAGSEIITLVGTQITVQIEDGVSIASNVIAAFKQSEAATELVNIDFLITYATNLTVQAETFLALTPYQVMNIQGIVYMPQPTAPIVTIVYQNDGVAGSETIDITGTVMTVHMETGVSTGKTINAALVRNSFPVTAYVSFTLLPDAGDIIQVAQTSTSFVTATPGTQFAVIRRGARGTTADAHDDQTEVDAGIQVGDLINTENALDMALKLQLSGWAGPWISDINLAGINISPDPYPAQTTSNILLFPSNVDVVNDYGLVAGDYLTIYGSVNASTNGNSYQIVRFGDFDGESNRIIYINQYITKEPSTTATVNFRSQYDQYPLNAGLMITPKDVDIAQHNYIKQTFLGAGGNNLMFFITAQEDSGKDFVQTEVYFPIGAFGLTRYGKLSVGYNSPPIANQTITTLDETNILNPDQIAVSRATNNRTLYNEIDFSYGVLDDGQTFTQIINAVSDPSLVALGGFTNPLPITSRGIYASYPVNLINKYCLFLLNKYAFSVMQIPLTINWQAASLIEVGDVVVLDDSKGILQIANFQTGKRGLGKQLFNVIDRSLDIKGGKGTVMLQGGLGATVTDRFATISPSSMTDVGSTTTQLIIKDSYGAIYPGNESKKWANYIGLPILVHSFDYSVSEQVTLISIDPINNYALNIGPLSFTPPANYIVDVPDYPTSADPTVNEFYKIMHAFLSPMVLVATGIDQRNFTVGSGDVSKFFVGSIIRVHSKDYSIDSGDITVTLITGMTITVDSPLGFVPAVNQQVNLIGFADKGQSYRWI